MLRGIYTSVSSMVTLQARQGIITNNLANINTTGYKEENLMTKSFDEVMLSNKDNYKNGKSKTQMLGNMSFGVRIDDNVTNYNQGTHISTDNKTDFAIQGNGFFEVQDENNNTYYTRDGSFKVNAQGYLVTNSGHYVLGQNNGSGNTERIYVGNSNISVNPNNTISIDGNNTYNFKIVDFGNYDDLNKIGNSLYVGENGFNTNNINIKQGYLETSNVDPIGTTALLMETVKEFEANQKVIQSCDSILNKIANDIGRV